MPGEWKGVDPNRDKVLNNARDRIQRPTPGTSSQNNFIINKALKSEILSTFDDAIHQRKPFVQTVTHDQKTYRCLGCVTENGRYQVFLLEEELARGGEGIVYKAQNVMTGAHMVVKAINANEQPQEFVYPEYQALKKLHRAAGLVNTAPNAPYYLVMPYYSGKPLIAHMYHLDPNYNREDARHFSKQAMSSETVVGMAYHLVNELIQLEEAGIIHRDVTPWNIIAADKSLHVVDYGGAMTRGSPRTASIGTFGYIPPEVDNPDLLPRGLMDTTYDRFSLGIILAEMLSVHNFQRYRITRNEVLRQNHEHRGLTLDEIKAGMPDVFDKDAVALESKQYQELVKMIDALLTENPAKRMDLRDMRYTLSKLYKGDITSTIVRRLEGASSKLSEELGAYMQKQIEALKKQPPPPKPEGEYLKTSSKDSITGHFKKRLAECSASETQPKAVQKNDNKF